MKISIITPTYNSEKFIDATINSIISQTYINWELLITDDCSTDSTWEIINNFAKNDNRIKVFQLNKNSGPGVARNNSIKEASGQFIAFCDSDDQWTKDKLEKQVRFMNDKSCALSYTSYKVIDEENNPKGHITAKSSVNYSTMLKNNYIGCLTAMYDTKRLGKVYMPKIRKRQDWALWLSILKKTDIAYGLQEPLAIYRDRSNSVSTKKMDLLKYNWAIYHKIEGFSKFKSGLLLLQFLFYYFIKKV